jgi:7,8-dihydropterin-6-yl-methyl-4-(beta-D-ribofuranosyl)aminobenzene 5'-phosphate synthase
MNMNIFALLLLFPALLFAGENVDKNQKVTITVVYDNYLYKEGLATAWGFSALIKLGGKNILFDTGGDGRILLDNMNKLNISPKEIDMVVLSHNHGDHTGGIIDLIRTGGNPRVFVPHSFPDRFKDSLRKLVEVEEISKPQEIAPGILTTGEMGRAIIEQSLIIKTNKGVIVITGCAHPGIVLIVEKAKELTGEPLYLVMGGFHLGGKSEKEISEIAGSFRKLGVINLAPSHCTGDRAISFFAREFGDHFLKSGVGAKFTIE